jgi:hypothetical protein
MVELHMHEFDGQVFAKVFPGPISCLIRHSPGLLMGGAESLKFVDSKMQTVADVKIGKVCPSSD